jgi:hypothetical protein
MLDHPADWRRALELAEGSAEGTTDAALLEHGFKSTVIAGLVESGLVTATTDRVLAGQHIVEVMRLRITDSGRVALGR